MVRQFKKVEYENLDTNYSYGSLAIDIWAQAEQEQEPVREVESKPKKKRFRWRFFKRAEKPLVENERKIRAKWNPNYMPRLLKFTSAIAFGMIMFTYFMCVLLGHFVVETQAQLVAMQHTEAQLISEINEMQIAVEQLKGPERIRDIAMHKLNMVVATDNVYVNAAKVKTVGECYRDACSRNQSIFYALGK